MYEGINTAHCPTGTALKLMFDLRSALEDFNDKVFR